MAEKTYVSPRKLDSLPVGTRIRFGDEWSTRWEKGEKGWREVGSSFPLPLSAKLMLAYNGNRAFVTEEESNG